MKTAAIYARVSSHQQRQDHTIESQITVLLEYASREDLFVPQEWIFIDEGYSGSVLVRPGLERLRDLAAEGQIEEVLIHSPDRLSRKYAYQVLLIEEFSRNGVEVTFVKLSKATTPEEELLLQFQGMIAEYERALITERSRRGKRHLARAGCVNQRSVGIGPLRLPLRQKDGGSECLLRDLRGGSPGRPGDLPAVCRRRALPVSHRAIVE